MTSSKPSIAFFGATGGSGSTCLAQALRAGHHCTALARTPTKLRTILLAQHLIPPSTLDTCLTIHNGNAKSPLDVSYTLVSPVSPSHLVDIIYFSLGTNPVFQWSLREPLPLPEADKTITEDAMRAIFGAIDTLTHDHGIGSTIEGIKPLTVIISATASKDIWGSVPWPWVFAPLYRWLLHAPHVDKMKMEELVYGDAGKRFRGFVIVRPAILTDGPVRGVEEVRAGWLWGIDSLMGEEREKASGPVVGWTIGRMDLGEWVFKRIVATGGEGWRGKCVSLCY